MFKELSKSILYNYYVCEDGRKTVGKIIRTLKEHQRKCFEAIAKPYSESSIVKSIAEQINASSHRLSFYNMRIIDHDSTKLSLAVKEALQFSIFKAKLD